MPSFLWTCISCLKSWKGQDFCCKISQETNIKFNLNEIAKKLAEAATKSEAESVVKSPWEIAKIMCSLHGQPITGMLRDSWEVSAPEADTPQCSCTYGDPNDEQTDQLLVDNSTTPARGVKLDE